MQWISNFILVLSTCVLTGIVLILGVFIVSASELSAVGIAADGLLDKPLFVVSLIAWIFPSCYISAIIASYSVEQEKHETLLRLFGLNCSNCKHLKKAFFRGLKCNLKNTSTQVSETCREHSEYSLHLERHQNTAVKK